MKSKRKRIAAVLYIILSVFALLFWLVFIFYAVFLGGSPGPTSYERGVPFLYAGIMALGLLGAALGIAAGVKGLGAKPAGKVLLLCAALLGAVGSVPFFLMELTEIGLFALIPGVLPTLLYLLLRGKRPND
jgi:hypothetical protein